MSQTKQLPFLHPRTGLYFTSSVNKNDTNVYNSHKASPYISRGQLKCDGTRADTRFCLSAKWMSPFKSAGWRQFSRLPAADVCASAVVMLDTPRSEVV